MYLLTQYLQWQRLDQDLAGKINYVLGITKAYTTRVGSGPFPTELKDEIGESLGRRGKEFGTVTARKRRCGWFDGVLVKQTIKISGINGIALTKLDVLDELDEIKMCVAYELNGKTINYLPAASEDQCNVKPIYKTFLVGKLLLKNKKSKDLLIMLKDISMRSRILLKLGYQASQQVEEIRF